MNWNQIYNRVEEEFKNYLQHNTEISVGTLLICKNAIAQIANEQNNQKTNVKVYFYVVVDSHGEHDWAVVRETSEDVHISGLTDENAEPISFEAEAYHLKRWCEENSLSLLTFEKSIKLEL